MEFFELFFFLTLGRNLKNSFGIIHIIHIITILLLLF